MNPALDQDGLIAIHEAKTVRKLAPAVFRLIRKSMRCELIIAALKPLEFELPGLCSEPRYQAVLDRYIASDHKLDIWLKRSPIHPRVTVVRHSDYTPLPILVKSSFYQRVLRPLNSTHGISLVVWRAATWLATFTILRNAAEGDFTAEELAFLHALQPHVSSAVKRIAKHQERVLPQRSFEYVADQSAQGIIILDWQLGQIYSNRSARVLARRWSDQPPARHAPALSLPQDIRQEIEKLKPLVEAAKPNRPFTPRHLDLRVLVKGKQEKFKAKLTYIPAKTLTITKGTFLVVITELMASAPALLLRFDKLTRRQAECVKYVAGGLNNSAIARKMGISVNTVRNQFSQALRTLGLKNRYQVAAAFIKSGQGPIAA